MIPARKRRDSSANRDAKRAKIEPMQIPSISNTRAAIDHLMSLTTCAYLPPIVLVHQIYVFIGNRTKADNEVEKMRLDNTIKVFKYNGDNDDTCICYTNQLATFIDSVYPSTKLDRVGLFIKKFLGQSTDYCTSKHHLSVLHSMGDLGITALIQAGFLAIKDTDEYYYRFVIYRIFDHLLAGN
jgi:hypothetical protein